MATYTPLVLPPTTQAALAKFGAACPIHRRDTHGIKPLSTLPLPPQIVMALRGLGLGPSGFGPSCNGIGSVPCLLHQPAFAAQVAVAYRALKNIPRGSRRSHDQNSYGVKHSVENAWEEAGNDRPVYICNGALIAAALAHGYPVGRMPQDPINALVRLKPGWRSLMRHNLEALLATGSIYQ